MSNYNASFFILVSLQLKIQTQTQTQFNSSPSNQNQNQKNIFKKINKISKRSNKVPKKITRYNMKKCSDIFIQIKLHNYHHLYIFLKLQEVKSTTHSYNLIQDLLIRATLNTVSNIKYISHERYLCSAILDCEQSLSTTSVRYTRNKHTQISHIYPTSLLRNSPFTIVT